MLEIGNFSPEFCDALRYSGESLGRHRIEERHCPEVILVCGHDNAVIGFGSRCNNHVAHIERESLRFAVDHDASPSERRSFVECQDSAGEELGRTIRTNKPGFECSPLVAVRQEQDAAPDFRNAQRRNVQVGVFLSLHPVREFRRWRRLDCVA